ncbi:unnamed protein product [marine sediment metagenome]|uniref:Preprotein translocase subunit YajC n=1 Tax=marine sediment metagenome TaxID=412755 RepID=X1P3T2_9ZZZZ
MRLSKRIISILIISILAISIGFSAVACLPITTTEEGGTTEGAQAEGPGSFADIFASYGTWVWLVILVAALYFLLIRPQRMRTKKAQELVSSLQRGDEVVTVGGFHGRIKDIREDVIIVTIASGVDVKINKSAVSRKATQ